MAPLVIGRRGLGKLGDHIPVRIVWLGAQWLGIG